MMNVIQRWNNMIDTLSRIISKKEPLTEPEEKMRDIILKKIKRFCELRNKLENNRVKKIFSSNHIIRDDVYCAPDYQCQECSCKETCPWYYPNYYSRCIVLCDRKRKAEEEI